MEKFSYSCLKCNQNFKTDNPFKIKDMLLKHAKMHIIQYYIIIDLEKNTLLQIMDNLHYSYIYDISFQCEYCKLTVSGDNINCISIFYEDHLCDEMEKRETEIDDYENHLVEKEEERNYGYRDQYYQR